MSFELTDFRGRRRESLGSHVYSGTKGTRRGSVITLRRPYDFDRTGTLCTLRRLSLKPTS